MMSRSNMPRQMEGGRARAAAGAGNANTRSIAGSDNSARGREMAASKRPSGKGLEMAALKAAGRGSAKGQEMRKFGCGGKVKKYAKGGKIDGAAKRGKTKCKIC